MKDNIYVFLFPLLVAIAAVFLPIAIYFFIIVLRIGTFEALPFFKISIFFAVVSGICVYLAYYVHVYKIRKKPVKHMNIFKNRRMKLKEEDLPRNFLDNYRKEIEEGILKYIKEDEERAAKTARAAKDYFCND